MFKEFSSNGRDQLMENVRRISFGAEPNFLDLHAFSRVIYCGLHPSWAKDESKHFLLTLDYKDVKRT